MTVASMVAGLDGGCQDGLEQLLEHGRPVTDACIVTCLDMQGTP